MKKLQYRFTKFNLILALLSFMLFAECKTAGKDFFSKRFGKTELNAAGVNKVLTFAVPLNEDNVYEYAGHNLEFMPQYLQARWVGYFLTKENLKKHNAKRSSKFYKDKKIKTGSAENSDYKGSGYDRGHLAPAADMQHSNQAIRDSFLLSNISPQEPAFNRGKWLELETFVRNAADKNGVIYIFTGPVINGKEAETIGRNRIPVPEYFYKVLLIYTESAKEAVGFILPNTKLSGHLKNFAHPIDKVEFFSGIDFFSYLPDEEENKIEAAYNENFWFEE